MGHNVLCGVLGSVLRHDCVWSQGQASWQLILHPDGSFDLVYVHVRVGLLAYPIVAPEKK